MQSLETRWYDDDQEEMNRASQPLPATDELAGRREPQPVPVRPAIESSPGAPSLDPSRSPGDSILHDAALDRAPVEPRASAKSKTNPRGDRSFLSDFGDFPEVKVENKLGQVPPAPIGEPQTPESETARPIYANGSLKAVLPYADYQPDGSDPCLSQCPRPEDCKDSGEGRGFLECPPIVQLSEAPYEGRLFADALFTWESPDLWYNPLYFEDAALERYGHTYGCVLQPFVSAGKFSAHLLALPYQMSIDPMCSRQYSLGWYRPGECAPKLCYQPPLNADAAAATAGFYTGMFYIFP